MSLRASSLADRFAMKSLENIHTKRIPPTTIKLCTRSGKGPERLAGAWFMVARNEKREIIGGVVS